MRSRFQLFKISRKCSVCSLLMYCSPRLTMYGWTLRGPASRLPGSTPSLSSFSAALIAWDDRAARECARTSLGALGDSFGATSSGAAGPALRISMVSSVFVELGASAAFNGAETGFRTGAAAAVTGSAGSLRATTAFFTAAGRLAAFLPIAAYGAGLLAGVGRSSHQKLMGHKMDGRLYRRNGGCTDLMGG